MFYEKSVSIPSNTPDTDPVGTPITLVPGMVDHVEIQFWAGARGNVGVRITERDHQVWPTNPGSWFRGEDHVIVFNEQYKLEDRPYVLVVEGYNNDLNYDHEVVVRFGVNTGKWSVADLVSMLTVPREVV